MKVTHGQILIIVRLILLLGGVGGYYGYNRYGGRGVSGVLSLVLIIILVTMAAPTACSSTTRNCTSRSLNVAAFAQSSVVAKCTPSW